MQLKHFIVALGLLPLSAFAQEVWSLEKCIQYAKDNNIQIRQTELQADLQKRVELQSKARFLPSVNGQASNNYNFGRTIDPFTNQFVENKTVSAQAFLSSNLNVFNGFQNWTGAAQAHYDHLASIKDIETRKNDISLSIATAYLQILFGKELVKNAENQLEITKLQRDRISRLVNAGSLAESNLFDIEAQFARDELQKVNAENNLNLYYLQLFQYLQLDISTEIEVQVPGNIAIDGSGILAGADDVYKAALDIMPELQAQKLRLKSAEYGLKYAYGSMSPRLSLSASYGSIYSGNNKAGVGQPTTILVPFTIVDGNNNSYTFYNPQTGYDSYQTKSVGTQFKENVNKSIGFSLTIPIFNNLSTNTAIKRAQVNNLNQKLQLDAAKNTLQQTVQRAHNDAVSALKQYQAAEKLVIAQKESFKYADIKYQQSLINLVEYTDAKIKLSNAENDLIRAKYDYIFKSKVIDFYQGKQLSLN